MPGPFDDLIPAGGQKPAPVRGYIPGIADPYKKTREERDAEDQSIKRSRELRDIELDRIKSAEAALKLEEARAKNAATGGIDASVEQGKAAGFALRAERANKTYEGVKLDPDSMIGKFGNAVAPDITASFSTDDRNAQRSREKDFIAAVLRYESGAAIPDTEYATAYQIYFPSPSAGPKEIEAKRIARENAIEGLRLGAGPNVARIGQKDQASNPLGITVDPALANEDGVIVNPPPNRGGLPEGTDIRFGFQGSGEGFDRSAYLSGIGIDPNKEANLVAGLNAISGKEGLTAEDMIAVYAQVGAPLPNAADFQAQLENARKGMRFGPIDSNAAEQAYKARIEQEKAQADATLGQAGVSDLAQQGITLGLSDEASGVGTALSALLTGDNVIEGYQVGRDVERARLDEARKRTGWFGTAAELAGGGAALGPGSIINGAAQTTRQMVNQGALTGGLTGFGYGEGALQSTVGAGTGAAGGAALTGLLVKGADAVASRIGSNPAALAQRQTALETATAAADEGIAIPRAMVDPNAAVRATALDSTMAGRPVINRTMEGVSNAVEGRVGNLSAGRVITEKENVGNIVRTAAEREIKNSGAAANRAYTKAENLAGDAKVAPTNAVQSIQGAIKELSETAGMNSAEINFLKTLETDFSKDLSVGALRRARTKLRKLISKGELTFGESEARVLDIMKSASDDIRAGLVAQGRGDAAKAFDVADKAYAERMDFISGTLQKLVGRRQDNFSGETIANKLKAMQSGDTEGLKKFFNTLAPDEKADIAATIADGLGKNKKGEFSLAILANNIENLPPSARETVFGADGAKSLANLKKIAVAFDKVKRNTSNTGIGNDWRSILASAFFGGGVPLAAGGGGTTAAALAVTAGGAKLGRDYISARMVMSPNFQKWLQKAVVARTPEQIANSFNSLRRVGITDPAIAGEVRALTNYFLKAANDTGPISAAANSDQREPSQPNQTARTEMAPR